MNGYIARLSNGQVIKESDKTWLWLKEALERNLSVNITELSLMLNGQIVKQLTGIRDYNYHKKVVATIGGVQPNKTYFCIGGSKDKYGIMYLTWFDTNGNLTNTEERPYNKCPYRILVAE